MKWHFKNEAVLPSALTNVVVAVFTTAQAGLKLFECLHTLGQKTLYYDTDSIVFVSKPGQPEPPVGSTLGDLTDDLAEHGVGSYVTSFFSGGPKFYAFEYQKPKGCVDYVCKLKGIRLHRNQNSRKINYQSIRKIILEESGPIEVTISAERRTVFHDVLTVTENKPTCLRQKAIRWS